MAGGMHWIQESFADTAACSQRRRSGLQKASGSLQLQGIVFFFRSWPSQLLYSEMTMGKISAGHGHNIGRRNHAVVHLLPWHTAQHVNQHCWGREGEGR